jgi:hypothetical protein
VDGRIGVAQVFDPDRRTSQLISQLTRIVRVRTWVTRSPGWSERAQVQQAAVPILMATAKGIRTPELLAAVEVDDRTMAVVEEHPQQLRLLRSFAPEAISDEALARSGARCAACTTSASRTRGCTTAASRWTTTDASGSWGWIVSRSPRRDCACGWTAPSC